MTSQKPETQSQALIVGDYSELELRVIARMIADSKAVLDDRVFPNRISYGGTVTGRMTSQKPFHDGGVISAEKMREMIEKMRPVISAHIERVRVAPGKREAFTQALAQHGGIEYTREKQPPGTIDWSNFGGLTVVEDSVFCGFIGAMDWSNGKVELFDWTPKEISE